MTGRELSHLQPRQTVQIQQCTGLASASLGTTGPLNLKQQLFPRRAGRLEPILVAQQVHPLAARIFGLQLTLRPLEPHVARMGPDQTGKGAQETGLARAIGPGQGHGLACRHTEVQSLKQEPFATDNGQILHVNSANHPSS